MIRRVAAVIALVAVLAGCSAAGGAGPAGTAGATPSHPITVHDALGRDVRFDAPPSRIVVASARGGFIIADAVYLFPEARSRVVATSNTIQNRIDFLPVVDANRRSKTLLDSSAGAEQVAATRPDVVVTRSGNADTLGRPLESLGIKVVYVDFETPEQYERDLDTLGQLFDDRGRAEQLKAYFRDAVTRTSTALAGLADTQKPRVLLVYYSNKNGTTSFNVPPLGYIQTSLVRLAGGRVIWTDAQLGSGWTTVSLEQIASWDPDQVYVVAYSTSATDAVRAIKEDSTWRSLRAVRQDAVYAFPGDYYSWDQPDPRWILGLTWLAHTIHPERFPAAAMDAEVRSFYRDLYGMDAAAFAKDVEPYLTGDLR